MNTFKTKIHVHISFWVILAVIMGCTWIKDGFVASVYAADKLFIVYSFVIMHEWGHIAAAARYGIRTESITVMALGCTANLESIPKDPKKEFVIAIAGPLVNIMVGAVLLVIGLMYERAFGQVPMFLAWAVAVNVTLAVFNLIPAYPMDGGRILRALLAMRLDYLRATLWAKRVSWAFASVMVVLSLMGNPMWMLLAAFIFITSEAEYQAILRQHQTRIVT